jgi:hypothetical protein
MYMNIEFRSWSNESTCTGEKGEKKKKSTRPVLRVGITIA